MRIYSLLIAVAACTPSAGATHPRRAADIVVTTEPTCPRAVAGCDILEILDVHTDAASVDKGFAELRELARARGGDAVLGAEFEHGEPGGRSHLAGVIVKYGAAVPPHTVLGEIEIASDPDDQEKGLGELMARAARMGGDQVIGVTFEHGEGGHQGRLRGRVIRFDR